MIDLFVSVAVMSQFNPDFYQLAPNSPFEVTQLNARDLAQNSYQKALQAHETGEIETAIQGYQQAIELDSNFDAPYINLGIIFISFGQLDKAKLLFERVLQLPDRDESPASIHALAYYNLGIIDNRLENTTSALEEIKKTLAIAPDFAQAQEFLKQLENAADF